jgi:hypothetical protein
MTETGLDSVMTQRTLTSDASCPLSESAFNSDGTFPVRIIAEGWGSSGFYSKKILTKSAGLYKSGTKMFINHASRAELKERPERDLNQLAAYFIEDQATWQDNGIYGPGLYQTAKALPNYADFIKEAAPVIGVSHFVLGKTRIGEAGGKTGPIVESIDAVLSVDFVTQPGAKGSIGAMYESWVNSDINSDDETHELQISETQGNTKMAETKESSQISPEIVTESRGDWLARIESLREAEKATQTLMRENDTLKAQITEKDTEINSLKESLAREQEKNILGEAATYAAELVEKLEIPEIAKDRIKTALINQATMKEGKLDKDALKAIAESEIEYAKSLTGSTGTVRGLGGSAAAPATVTMEESKKALIESYKASGMSEETAKQIVERF